MRKTHLDAYIFATRCTKIKKEASDIWRKRGRDFVIYVSHVHANHTRYMYLYVSRISDTYENDKRNKNKTNEICNISQIHLNPLKYKYLMIFTMTPCLLYDKM